MAEPAATLPKGSWVLVTGITGLVASHVAKQFLDRGYKVRGTVRDLVKASWLRDDLFKSHAEKGNLDLVVVSDLGADNAFDDAVKGMSAIIHLATVVDLDPDPNHVVPRTVRAVTSILSAALNEPSVKEFVYTSSYSAAATPIPGQNTHVERDTWNEFAVQLAWAPPPYTPERGFLVYVASKVAAEKEVWKFVEEKSPSFTVNVISPSAILGQPLNKHHAESNGAWIKLLLYGQTEVVSQLAQSKFVSWYWREYLLILSQQHTGSTSRMWHFFMLHLLLIQRPKIVVFRPGVLLLVGMIFLL